MCHFCLLCAAVCAAPCPNVYVSHRFVYDAQRQSIFSSPPPSLPFASCSFSHSLAHPILKLYFWPFCGNCLLFGSGSGSNNLLLLLLLPPHHFLLTKNSLLGNFSLFILFATLQKCLYPGQSMPQMHSIVPIPFSSLSVVANRLPFTVRIPCISIEH